MNRRYQFWTNVLALVGLLSLALSPAHADDKKKQQQNNAVQVGVDLVRTQPLTQTIPVIGRMVSLQTGYVASQVEGLVADILADVGDRVEKGDVLVQLRTDRLELEIQARELSVKEATASVASEKAQLKILNQELGRLHRLKKSSAFNQSRFDDLSQEVNKAQSKVHASEAVLLRMQAQLELLRIDLADASIRAPYAGVVSQRHTEVGSFIKEGDRLVSLVNDSRLEIEADVPSAQAEGLFPGVPVNINIDRKTNRSFRAVVRATVPLENPRTRTRIVRFISDEQDNPNLKLAAGQSVILHLPAGVSRNVLTVHKDAVLARKGQNLVFLVEQGKANIRPVQLGNPVGGRFEVVAGLKEGDEVVIRGNERLLPGQAVKPINNAQAENTEGAPKG